MNEKIPYTPFSTRLSGSARETELRLKHIFSGPKKRPPALFLALVFSVCVLCGNLVSCQSAEAENLNNSNVPQPDLDIVLAEGPDPVSALSAPELSPDLNQNGIPEEIRLENEYGWPEVRFYENGQLILRESSPDVYLCRLAGTDYILRWHLNEYQGYFWYGYDLARFDGEFEETQQWKEVVFDTNFNALFHREFDPEAIAAFVEELNELLSHSVRLSHKDEELLADSAPPVELDWLDAFPDVFVPDPDKTLLENLQSFRDAMPQDLTPPTADQAAVLPGQSYALMFCSGAGAWQTTLTLQAGGQFEGYYEDADLDTHYVCQFHGRFGNIVQISGASYYMTLEELVLDTKRPVGGEWDEGGVHYVSSEPYGFDGADGKALKPGAGFIFYLPEATGRAPGSELYGAMDFVNWHPTSASDPLGCYGLHNLETGYGFFDLHAWGIE